jgi:hypothetical protein
VNAQKRGLQEEVEILSEGLKAKSIALKSSETALEASRSEIRDLRQQLADHRELRDLKSRLTQVESIAYSSSSFSPSPAPARSGSTTPHGHSRSGSPVRDRPERSVRFDLASPPRADTSSAPSSSPPRTMSPPIVARVNSLSPLPEEQPLLPPSAATESITSPSSVLSPSPSPPSSIIINGIHETSPLLSSPNSIVSTSPT